MTRDAGGNLYLAGHYWGEGAGASFGPDPNDVLTSTGFSQYALKMAPITGEVLWVKQLGTGTTFSNPSYVDIAVHQLTPDAAPVVYVTGAFSGTVDLDPGPRTAPLTTGSVVEQYTVALDAQGDYDRLWHFRGADSSSYSRGQAIVVDGTGHAYLTGQFRGTVEFPPGSLNAQTSERYIVRFLPGPPAENVPPVAASDVYTCWAYYGLTATTTQGVLMNDVDAYHDSLGAVLVAGPSHGTLALEEGGGFRYTPLPGYSGIDTFTYKAEDGSADSNLATVTITVQPLR